METPLTPELLCVAYSEGYFPMPDPTTGKIVWFSPDPRAIVPLDRFHVSHSLRRRLNRGDYEVARDRSFLEVMRFCADRPETWITDEFFAAYSAMAERGLAHSLEIWRKDKLVGGVYGVALGGAFFAESKFHRETDMSKVALYHLTEHLRAQGFVLLEVQFLTAHLAKLGAIELSAREYQRRLKQALKVKATF